MNLLLTSCGLETDAIQQTFVAMLNKPMNQIRALFIPTAANSPDAIDWSQRCRNTAGKAMHGKSVLRPFTMLLTPIARC